MFDVCILLCLCACWLPLFFFVCVGFVLLCIVLFVCRVSCLFVCFCLLCIYVVGFVCHYCSSFSCDVVFVAGVDFGFACLACCMLLLLCACVFCFLLFSVLLFFVVDC